MNKNTPSYKFYKASVLIFLMFISAIKYNLLINPAKIVAGGTNGLSILLESIFKWNPAVSILVIDVAILLVALLLKEYELTISAVLSSFIYPFFIQITSSINGAINVGSKDMFIIAVFSGIITGIITGITCKLSISQGGIVLISQLISKNKKKSTSKVNLLINLLIVICGGYIFGIYNLMYSLVYLYSSKIATDKIILGTSQKKLFKIITTKDDEIIKYITEDLNSGVTTFTTKGAFNEKKRTVIMTSVTNRDYFRLKEGVREIDKDAFVVITDSYQVKGGK